MRCKHCGAEISDSSYICLFCEVTQPDESEDGNIGLWGILCFLFSPAGIILYALWKHKMPMRASSSGSDALYGRVLFLSSFFISLERGNDSACAVLFLPGGGVVWYREL